MGSQDARQKNRETRCETEKKWGDMTGDEKKWGDETPDKKKMGGQDQYGKKWGDKT